MWHYKWHMKITHNKKQDTIYFYEKTKLSILICPKLAAYMCIAVLFANQNCFSKCYEENKLITYLFFALLNILPGFLSKLKSLLLYFP